MVGRLDLAIARAQRQLSASITKTGQVIVITDSADDLEKTLQAAIEAANQGNRVSVLAVGTSEGAPLKNAKRRAVTQTIRVALYSPKLIFLSSNQLQQQVLANL